ncbi:hypothetical protein FPV67DRAFT_1682577 [Lyophyllum atratum]|nr:hypothetical protein FPV67DRAFT_1682577 [Lyophyllum atratum]
MPPVPDSALSSSDESDSFDELFDSDGESNDILYEVGEVPEALHTDDPLNQDEFLTHVHLQQANSIRNSFKEKFKEMPVRPIKLSELRRRYEHQEHPKSIRSLGQRHKIVLDDESIFPSNADNLFWKSTNHFLDFRMIVSTSMGLDALIPGGPNHNWSFTFTVSSAYRVWRTNYGKLGFDPNGRMLHIGRCQQEDVWIAFAPLAFVLGTLTEEDPAPDPKANTRVASTRVRQWLAFVCSIFHEMGLEDIYCDDPYPDVTNDVSMAKTCNIPRHRDFELNMAQVKQFHELIQSNYVDYFDEAPTSWKKDSFFRKHRPISITARYGQNQPMELNNPEVGTNWNKDRDFSKIRSISFAIATDICCIKIERWDVIDAATIVADNRNIYDSAHQETRVRVEDLEALPQLDEYGNPILIYNDAGERISRRKPIIRCRQGEKPVPCGLLINLEDLHELFESPMSDIDMDDEPDASKIKYYIYPQAFLQKHGHYQAHGLISPFQTVLADINTRLRIPEQQIPAEDDTSDLFHNADPLTGVSSQAYNEAMHRIRHRAGLHDVQLGRITAAAAGTHAETKKGKGTAEKCFQKCDPDLPHQRFAKKIDTPGIKRELRMENVYCLDLLAMPVTHRKGRVIYDTVITTLAKAWTTPSIVSLIRPHITVFREDCFPNLYKWVSYPITLLLESFWKEIEERHRALKPVSPYTQELVCMLERSLNFCQTGAGKVIVRGLMEEAGLALGLLTDGMPMLWSGVNLTRFDCPSIIADRWPTQRRTNKPAIASKRSMVINYGEQHAEVYQARFFIEHTLVTMPSDLYQSFKDDTMRRCLIIARLSMESYVGETKTMVVEGITQDLQPLITGGDVIEVGKAEARAKRLKKWASNANPFSSEPNISSLLLLALIPDGNGGLASLPEASPPRMALSRFVSDIYDMCKEQEPRPKIVAPLIKQGSAHTIITMAIRYIHHLLPRSDLDKTTKSIFVRVIQDLKVNTVPWQLPVTGRPGATSTKPTHMSWVNLGLADSGSNAGLLIAGSQGAESSAIQAAVSAHAVDTQAAYNILALKWSESKHVFTRTSLPTEWSVSHAKENHGYVRETYEFVQMAYDGTIPIHGLAMLMAQVMALLAPNVFSDNINQIPMHLNTESTSNEITQAVKSSPWTSKGGNRKGCSEPGPYITMVSTFIIAIFDVRSPLRKHMAAHHEGLGDKWAKKHSAKGIMPYNLVRLGLATAHSNQIFKAAKFGSAYKLISDAEVLKLHTELKAKMTSGNRYGPYNALLQLVGPEAANDIAERGECPCRPLGLQTLRHPISSDDEAPAAPARKRVRR